jgi:hypothetical protein
MLDSYENVITNGYHNIDNTTTKIKRTTNDLQKILIKLKIE